MNPSNFVLREIIAPASARLNASSAIGFANEIKCEIKKNLLEHGYIVLRNFTPCIEEQVFEATLNTIGLKLRDYIGGTSPRNVLKGKIMEATHTPENWSIILHQEMAYITDMPAVIAFCCQSPAFNNGGVSLIGDMRLATSLIPSVIKDEFRDRGLCLRRMLPSKEHLHLKPGIKKCWEETLNTSKRSEAEFICKNLGWNFEWNSKGLTLWQEILPPERTHSLTGESIWCNQAHFFNRATMIAWAERDGRINDVKAFKKARIDNSETLEAVCFGDGAPIPDYIALELFRIMAGIEQQVALSEGDIIVLDNLISSHGRTMFSGKRKLTVGLCDWNQQN